MKPLCCLFAVVFVLSASGKPDDTHIGSYYADAWNGIALIHEDSSAFLTRIGWVDSDNVHRNGDIGQYYHRHGQGFLPIIPQNRPLWVKECAPDFSISRIGWKVGATRVMLEWGRTGRDGYAGRISVDGPAKIALEVTPSWEIYDTTYRLTKDGFNGVGKKSKAEGGGDEFRLRVDCDPVARTCMKMPIQGGNQYVESMKRLASELGKHVVWGVDKDDGEGNIGSLLFNLKAGDSVRFVGGTGKLPKLSKVDSILEKALAEYLAKRTSSKGAWGDFVNAMMNNLHHTRLYNWKTHERTYSVSRRWSNYDGVVIFNWDSCFNALMGNLEDPERGKDTIRGLLAAQLDTGLIPNFTGPRWGVSDGRSQRTVSAMCVWKMHQRWPCPEFLEEVFPKLLKGLDWWIGARDKGGLPRRDGNRDGLLSCGDEGGDPAAAMFEGLDNAPQWAEMVHSDETRTFRCDMVDLSALWVMEAHYLAIIADELGKKEDAGQIRAKRDRMAGALDNLCWSDSLGVWCNRFWHFTDIMPCLPIPADELRAENDAKGLTARYYQGGNFEDMKMERTDSRIDFKWDGPPAGEFGGGPYTVRWTGKVAPKESRDYLFGTRAVNGGAKVYVNNELILDYWDHHLTEPKSPYGVENDRAAKPVKMEAGKEYDIQVEYRCNGGKAEVVLRWHKLSEEKDGLLSRRMAAGNMYPLITGLPNEERGKAAIAFLADPRYFWGEYVPPTISRDDPTYPNMDYWQGRIWAPTSYLLYQGVKKYAPDELRADYARKSVKLFMKNWIGNGGCWENYHANGEGGNDPHYTWGALLCLIGLEEICDILDDGSVRLNGTLAENILLRNIPIHGKLYDVKLQDRKAQLIRNGAVILEAAGKVIVADIEQ